MRRRCSPAVLAFAALYVLSTSASANHLRAVQDALDVVLTWTPAPGVTMDVLRATVPLGPFVLLGQTDSGTFRDLNAVPGAPINPTFYVYKVEAPTMPRLAPTNYAFKLSALESLAAVGLPRPLSRPAIRSPSFSARAVPRPYSRSKPSDASRSFRTWP